MTVGGSPVTVIDIWVGLIIIGKVEQKASTGEVRVDGQSFHGGSGRLDSLLTGTPSLFITC